ncbi:FlgD immunoglobulin-like domain containing protein [Fodinibius sp.]|uniref:FlgD immunoglobulin-like domain containing protein n=1 Tax=Fodinibius sp. TaxID=1872440 RepID=UPI002ACDECA1|nr:FlgD immunoglobulin-like domain containing protein [Fodinibius sp.]MDZ7659212.1 FlgD immunoglobulin-like domain containing protein [Fodinibius sp.]
MSQTLRIPTLFIIIMCGWVFQSQAQIIGPVPSPKESIAQNSVSNMAALGDTLWIGPALNRTINNSTNWFYPEGATEIVNGNGRVFSLALAPDTVIAGLGYNADTPDGSVQAGLGFHISVNGGNSWNYIENPNEAEDDTSFVYGGTTYQKLPITTQEQSPPFDIAQRGSTIFSANWALGLVRSQNFGQSWQRIILPPQQVDSLVPEQEYEFNSNEGNRYDPRYDQNLLGFSVFIDNRDRVWVGTAGGLNISENALTAPADSIRWRHIQFNSSENSLPANWIITIKQHPSTGDIWLTNWPSGISDEEQFGIARTSDSGQTFDHYLSGKRINDIGFKDGTIYAVGDNGFFKSTDNGNSWNQIPQIKSANTFIKESAQYYSLASTTDRLWVGTSDGLASTADGGQSWQITRVDFPLDGQNRYQKDAPSVETYAYPNPFSPRRHDIVRIKYEVPETGKVQIRLFDFGMNLVRELDGGDFSEGTYEAVWDGRDAQGNQVANGPIFYQIDTASGTIRGKILVVD